MQDVSPIEIVTGTAASIVLPAFAARAALSAPRRAALAEQLGRGAWGNAGALDHPLWLHGASVGEIGGLLPVARELRSRFPGVPILGSCTSRTGRIELEKNDAFDQGCLLPFDHPWVVRRALDHVNPLGLVISETEIWPNLCFYLRRRNIPAVLINARISDYSFPRYQKITWVLRPAFQSLRRIMAQTQLDAERFIALGVNPNCVSVGGSTKYDQELPQRTSAKLGELVQQLGIQPGAPCFVAGSVRPGEEEIVCAAYLEARKQVPNLQMIFAPRHPERFDAVADLFERLNIPYVRRSAKRPKQPDEVVLLDTIGELRAVYGLGDFAFVGGTLVDIGGHNPLEPAGYSIPVVVGPYTSNVRDAVHSMRAGGAYLEARTAQDLAQCITHLSQDHNLRTELGRRAFQVWQANSGATARVVQMLQEELPLGGASSRSTVAR